MFKYTNAFTNRSGDSLPGYFARLYDSDGNPVDIFADANGTPISTVSGVANAALSDENGMFRWYVANGAYDIRFYDANDVFVSVEPGIPMFEASQVYIDLSDDTGAALVGSTGGLTVQASLNARPTAVTLAATGGAGMVGTSDGGTVQALADRLNTGSVDLRAFGGIPDVPGTTTHRTVNSTALTNALASGATTIQLKANSDTETEYSFASAWPLSDMAGVTLDVDERCSMDHASLSDVYSLGGAAISYVRSAKHTFRDVPCTFYSRPQSNPVTFDKTVFIEPQEPDGAVHTAIDCDNTAILAQARIPWNNSDTWEVDSFASGTNESYTITPGSTDGKLHVGLTRLYPGKRLFGRPGIAVGTPLLIGLVRHTGGYVGLMCGTAGGSPNVDLIQKQTGAPGTATTLSFTSFPGGTHASYQAKNSEWAFSVDGWNKVSILFNGMLVATLQTSGQIYDGGFGMYPLAASDSVVWNDLVRSSGMKGAGQLYAGLGVGDSRTQERDGTWVSYAKQALDLSYGIRCYRFDDIAAGGDDTAAQLAVLQAMEPSLSGYNFAHVNIGTNDAQGLVALSTFKANIQDIYDILNTNGVFVTFSIFDLWYTQGQAGSRGQASTNYEQSAPYRSFLRRFCADNGIRLVDETLLSGPVLANFVNDALSPDLTETCDPWVFDNIHHSSLAGRVRGQAIARAILGNLMTEPSLELGNQTLTPQNGWVATIQTPVVNITADGSVRLEGVINDTGGATHTDGTVIATLPRYLWRNQTLRFRCQAQNLTELGFLNVDLNNGEISINGFATSTYIDLACVQFTLRP